MRRRSKGPRLWFRPARRNAKGIVTHSGAYVILDDGRQIGTGTTELVEAEKELAKYIAEKYRTQTATRLRPIEQIPVSDVIAIYARDVAPEHSDPKETSRRLNRLLKFFGNKSLAEINGALCREYLRQATSISAAARDLTDFRSAINHHRREGLHDRIVSVITPPQTQPRERWLERSEAAALLWAAWRRPRCKHIAKFILLALYTGRRCSVISLASFKREPGPPMGRPVQGLPTAAGRRQSNEQAQPDHSITGEDPDTPAGLAPQRRPVRCWVGRGFRWQGRANLEKGCKGHRVARHRNSSHLAPHGRDVADASRNRFIRGQQVLGHDRPDA